MTKNKHKPGPGWKFLGCSVWQCGDLRLSLLGGVLLPGGSWKWAWTWPESQRAEWFIRVNGGNRKRGLMAWAKYWQREMKHDAPTYCIVANMADKDGVFRDGAKCYLVGGTGGEGWHRFRWFGMSAKSRKHAVKWCETKRMHNFRAAWIPLCVRNRFEALYPSGSKEEMQELALKLREFRETLCSARDLAVKQESE